MHRSTYTEIALDPCCTSWLIGGVDSNPARKYRTWCKLGLYTLVGVCGGIDDSSIDVPIVPSRRHRVEAHESRTFGGGNGTRTASEDIRGKYVPSQISADGPDDPSNSLHILEARHEVSRSVTHEALYMFGPPVDFHVPSKVRFGTHRGPAG